MKLSTGKVAFPIEFDNGDKAVIYFNPNDRGIQERIQRFESDVEEKIRQIDLERYKSVFEDGKTLDLDFENPEKLLEMSDEDLQVLHNRLSVVSDIEDEYDKIVMDELDEIFDSKISETVFRYCKPFDTVVVEGENGETKRELFMLHFLHWLMVELKKHGVENKAAVDKHIAKYAK